MGAGSVHISGGAETRNRHTISRVVPWDSVNTSRTITTRTLFAMGT